MAEGDNQDQRAEIERFTGKLPDLPGKNVDLTGSSLLNRLKDSPTDITTLGELRGIVRAGTNPLLARDLARTTLDPEDLEIYSAVAKGIRDPKRRAIHSLEIINLTNKSLRPEDEGRMKEFHRSIREKRTLGGETSGTLESIVAGFEEEKNPTRTASSSTELVQTDDDLLSDVRTSIAQLATDERPEDALIIAKSLYRLVKQPEDLSVLLECIFALDNPEEIVKELVDLPYDPYVNALVFRILDEGRYTAPERSYGADKRIRSAFKRNDRKLPKSEELGSMEDQEREAVFEENLQGLMGRVLLEHFLDRDPRVNIEGAIEEILENIVSYPFPLEHGLKRLDFARNAIPWIIKRKYGRDVDPSHRKDSDLLLRYTHAAVHLAGQTTDEVQKNSLLDQARWMLETPAETESETLHVNFTRRAIEIAEFSHSSEDSQVVLEVKDTSSTTVQGLLIPFIGGLLKSEDLPEEMRTQAIAGLRKNLAALSNYEHPGAHELSSQTLMKRLFYTDYSETLVNGFLALYDETKDNAVLEDLLKTVQDEIKATDAHPTMPKRWELGSLEKFENNAAKLFVDKSIGIGHRASLVKIWARQFTDSQEARTQLESLISTLNDEDRAVLSKGLMN